MITEMNGYEMGAFLPGLKKIGRYTSKVTGTIAKAFIPASLVDAAAKLDPSRRGLAQSKKSAAELLTPSPVPVKSKAKAAFSLSPAIIGIGVAALGALVLLGKRR